MRSGDLIAMTQLKTLCVAHKSQEGSDRGCPYYPVTAPQIKGLTTAHHHPRYSQEKALMAWLEDVGRCWKTSGES